MYSNPLSPSGLKLYKACPRKWADVYINGNRQPSGAAAQRGTDLHNMLEDFFNGAPYPSGNSCLAKWQRLMEGLAATDCSAEGELAVNMAWEPTTFSDPNAYYRGKMDLDYEAGDVCNIFDWKSGKIYDDHVFQGKSYAAMKRGFKLYKVNFVYLDHPHVIKTWEYTAPEVDQMRIDLSTDIDRCRKDEEYLATPGDECKWCHLSWRNGGDCKRAR